MQFKLHYFIGDREFVIDTRQLEEELAAYFPEKREQQSRFFTLIERMNREAMSGGPMKPPGEMHALEKVLFPFKMLAKNPTVIRYGLRPAVKVLQSLFGNPYLESLIWAFYPVHSLNFLSESWGWQMMRQGEYYYPEGGMQAIPDAAAAALEKWGGSLALRTEATAILAEDGAAAGVKCTNGEAYRAGAPYPVQAGRAAAAAGAAAEKNSRAAGFRFRGRRLRGSRRRIRFPRHRLLYHPG